MAHSTHLVRKGAPRPVRARRLALGPRLPTPSATPLLRVWKLGRTSGAAMTARVPRCGGRMLGVRDRPGTPREVGARGGMEEHRGPWTPLTRTRLVPCVWMTMPLFGAPTAGRATARLIMARGGALRQRAPDPEGLSAARPRSRGAAPSGRPRRRMCPASAATMTTHDSTVSTVVKSTAKTVTTFPIPVVGWPDAVAGSPGILWGPARWVQRSRRSCPVAALALMTRADQTALGAHPAVAQEGPGRSCMPLPETSYLKLGIQMRLGRPPRRPSAYLYRSSCWSPRGRSFGPLSPNRQQG